MFTGIIEELGIVKKLSLRANVRVLEIAAEKISKDVAIGDSIAVNGTCLTVVASEKGRVRFEVMQETFSNTCLGCLRVHEKVNLEPSLKLGERLSGHFVTGHVDCIGVIRKKNYLSNNLVFEIAVASRYLNYCVPKGSIAVDGISLTLMKKSAATFFVYIIPHTLKNTTLSFKGPSSKVNVEFDILMKK